ncbi:hypothetical protein CEXT_160411 [Caerostris extrusa]|uniref:Uncharacterized protein n=1 Tax=Caerostris extrusa TaxID=172846 RepID=A0AAV4WQR2_CAEEX|nr:hypothetical protein CEXT_160411 [Caerostris extrusa]
MIGSLLVFKNEILPTNLSSYCNANTITCNEVSSERLGRGCCLTSGVVRVEDGCPHEVRIEPQAPFTSMEPGSRPIEAWNDVNYDTFRVGAYRLWLIHYTHHADCRIAPEKEEVKGEQVRGSMCCVVSAPIRWIMNDE